MSLIKLALHFSFDCRPPIDPYDPATRVGFQATPFIAGCTDQLQLYHVLQKKAEKKAEADGNNYYRYSENQVIL